MCAKALLVTNYKSTAELALEATANLPILLE